MFILAVSATLLALAVPLSFLVRMLAFGHQDRAEIRARMSAYRRTRRKEMSSEPDLLPSDDFDASNAADLAALAKLTGQPTGVGDHTPADLLVTLRAVHAEMLRRKNSHQLLCLELSDLDQAERLFADPGPEGTEARLLGRRLTTEGYMVGVCVVADYGPNELPDDTDETDDTQGAAPTPPRTVTAPCHPARSNGHEVPTS
ncbi:hypothetical protein [Nonomuraea roseoviolacea]|uniref:Uncharacterized protein n=1 Tax=Nonomuraea roseoviolacea subsp. carminata TaxID=160689 RepID=A0ABT1K016_9ACTN|nr:hypothetical protein [Nonomuraea roseoviolacea]MCP2346927.1 hypothetical protein [Nonomuraea roseoviolacea subsp. carminata]